MFPHRISLKIFTRTREHRIVCDRSNTPNSSGMHGGFSFGTKCKDSMFQMSRKGSHSTVQKVIETATAKSEFIIT